MVSAQTTSHLFHFYQNNNWTDNQLFDDDEDDDDNYFYGMVDWRKTFSLISRSLSEILTVANLRHAASSIWTWTEPVFRLCWIKLYSSDNHYTTAPLNQGQVYSVFTPFVKNEEDQREKVSTKFGLGHALVKKRVNVLSSIYFKNSCENILIALKNCSDYIC